MSQKKIPLRFTRHLALSLRKATDIERLQNYDYFCLTGVRNCGPALAHLKIWIPTRFTDFKESPPLVWCQEAWMRDDPDWHNSTVSGMCWVLHDEWRDHMNYRYKSDRRVTEDGTRWLLKNVDNLISRHYLGELLSMESWPKKWSAWGHNEEGPKQYEQLKQQH